MNIGDEIILRGKVIDFDANPHGAAIKVEVRGFLSERDYPALGPRLFEDRKTIFWIHRMEQPEMIVNTPHPLENEEGGENENTLP